MVKADLTRDYYGDLEISPTADIAEIKKQFKKLALTYHPDRNPGHESEVTAKFQKIQSAHEVLIDTQERAKYDANRVRVTGGFRNAYAGSAYAGGTASGMKGNPWSNVSSQFPTPPKPPTARNRQQQPPPPSSGARRYEKFATPNQSAYEAAQKEPSARKATYTAWENMQHGSDRAQPSSSRTPRPGPPPPPRNPPQSGREQNGRPEAQVPPMNGRNFEEYRESNASHRRSQSSSTSNRKGFMPNTPGGDEPAAPMGAYFTGRNKPHAPPDPPPRQAVPPMFNSTSNPTPDPLRQFRERDRPSVEPRVSTPYASHGGEKTTLFGSANMSRSKSTRDSSDRVDQEFVPRTGSDPNLSSPHRAQSFAQRPSAAHAKSSKYERSESSSSEDLPTNGSSSSSSANRSNGSAPRKPQQGATQPSKSEQRKQSKILQFRQWMKENPGEKPPPNGFPPDGPPLRSGQATSTPNLNGSNGTKPSMYGSKSFPVVFGDSHANNSIPFQQLAESDERHRPLKLASKYRGPETNSVQSAVKSPSGLPGSAWTLNHFEATQRDYVEHLLSSKRTPSGAQKTPIPAQSNVYAAQKDKWGPFTQYRESNALGVPCQSSSKKSKKELGYSPSTILHNRLFWQRQNLQTTANLYSRNRFSFNLKDDTFKPTNPQPNGFSSSAENITTKFTPEDWAGTFKAGTNHFKPTAGAASPTRARDPSTSRSRGRSPPKARTDYTTMPRTDQGPPVAESPGGTKFSAEEWDKTFGAQTFMPPDPPPRPQQYRKRTIPQSRATMGGQAAVIDESDSGNDKPLFTDRKAPSPQTASPEPMDVDTPPVTHTVPIFQTKPADNLNLNADPIKRQASSSASQPVTDEEDLKVNFEDLKIVDIITSLDMPSPPSPPILPPFAGSQQMSRQAYDDYEARFAKYMAAWDTVQTKFLLHVVARKNQNDSLKEKRWSEKKNTDSYRRGLQEDATVMKRWSELTEKHGEVVKQFVILQATMASRDVKDENPSSSRKKTH